MKLCWLFGRLCEVFPIRRLTDKTHVLLCHIGLYGVWYHVELGGGWRKRQMTLVSSDQILTGDCSVRVNTV